MNRWATRCYIGQEFLRGVHLVADDHSEAVAARGYVPRGLFAGVGLPKGFPVERGPDGGEHDVALPLALLAQRLALVHVDERVIPDLLLDPLLI